MAERRIGDVVLTMDAIKREFFRWLESPKDDRLLVNQKEFADHYRISEPSLTKWKREFSETDFRRQAVIDLFSRLSDDELYEQVKLQPDNDDVLDEYEFRKCGGDEEYFIRTFCKILSQTDDEVSGDGEPIPFVLWAPQVEALTYFEIERNLVVLKTRRLGISWLAVAHCLHHALYRSNAAILYRSITLDDAKEQHERFKFMYDNLPQFFRDRVRTGPGKGLKRNDTESWFSNGSRLKMLTGSKSSGHGRSPTIVFWDEMARDQNDVYGMRAIKPAVASGGRVIIVSTSDGPNNQFAKLYKGAKKKRNTFTPIFFPASSHPMYTAEFLEAERREYEDRGDLAGFYQAYPETEDEAWQAASSCPFPAAELTKRERFVRKPLFRGIIEMTRDDKGREHPELVANERGALCMWEASKKKNPDTGVMEPSVEPIPGRMYYLGVDISEGLTNGDYSAFTVVDGLANRIVARFRAKIDPEVYALPIEAAARYYNDALVGPETNKFDCVTADLKESYWNLFMRERRDKPWDEPTLVVGWYTGSKSKKEIVNAIRRALTDDQVPLDIPDEQTLTELHTFEEDERQRYSAPKGEFDDCVISLGIALAMRDAYRGREPIMAGVETGLEDDDSELPVAAYDLSA